MLKTIFEGKPGDWLKAGIRSRVIGALFAVCHWTAVKTFSMKHSESRVGLKVRALQKAKGLIQLELAEKSDLSVDTNRDTERGVKRPSVLTLEKLAAALEVSVMEFYPSPAPPGPIHNEVKDPMYSK